MIKLIRIVMIELFYIVIVAMADRHVERRIDRNRIGLAIGRCDVE